MKISVLLVVVLFLPRISQAQVIYVNQAATGANDGTSWADAYVYLQDALGTARRGSEVWITEGAHRPDMGATAIPMDQASVFHVAESVLLYGGFIGGEVALNDRDPTLRAVLTGDLLGNDDKFSSTSLNDNSHTVVEVGSGTGLVVMDQIHITGANGGSCVTAFEANLLFSRGGIDRCVANGSGGGLQAGSSTVAIQNSIMENNQALVGRGGAIRTRFSRLAIDDTVFRGNVAAGGGGAISATEGIFEVRSSTFESNSSADWGGAIEVLWSSDVDQGAYVANSVFVGNEATWGGGISIELSRATIVGSVFSGNRARFDGGGVSVSEATVRLISSTLSANQAGRVGPGVVCFDSDFSFLNSIAWSAQDVGGELEFDPSCLGEAGNSLLRGGVPGGITDLGGVISNDPAFVHAEGLDGTVGTIDDDLRLTSGSPARDSGLLSYLPIDSLDVDGDGNRGELLPLDVAGAPRQYGTIDLGAYEAATSIGREAQPGSSHVVAVFPNPAVGLLRVDATRPFNRVQVYDLVGRAVKTAITPASSGLDLDVSSLAVGPYLIVVSWENNVVSTILFHKIL